jgi:hypothetical protein
MKRSLKKMSRLFEAMQRRFRKARPGSVLIMVVALLVLLALIGTAAMSTARMDRQSSAQNVANTQIEMLAEGVKQMVIGQLVADLSGTKDATSSDSLKDFFNGTDSVMSDPNQGNRGTQDAILGSRLPERLVLANSSSADPIWRALSYPPFANGNAISANHFSQFRFDPPDDNSANDQPLESMSNGNALQLSKSAMMPTFYPFKGQNLPGLQPVFADGKLGQKFMAADADGDGVADALLFRLPISSVRGVTYYGAIRVVDNGAALNVNTARTPDYEVGRILVPDPAATQEPFSKIYEVSLAGVFPASVNLVDLLYSNPPPTYPNAPMAGSEFARLDSQVQTGNPNSASGGNWVPSQIIQQAIVNPPYTGYQWQLDDKPYAYWITQGDLMHHQLGRRLDNPGYLTGGSYFGNGVRPFGVDTSLTLARGFTLVDPGAHDSLPELMFPRSLMNPAGGTVPGVASRPYLANQAGLWFTDNFDYAAAGTSDARLRRALLTSLNPVRNNVFRHDPAMAIKYPTKTNLNTATFEELRTSFYDVMCDGILNTPFDDDAGVAVNDPYTGMHFTQDLFLSISKLHPSRMFRSPLRPPSANATTAMQPFQVMQLRSAIAAMNVLSMRAPYDVQPQNVVLAALPGSNGKAYTARIYGLKKQPFITEIYLNNNPEIQIVPSGPNGSPLLQNQSGFAAIELYNPYDEDLDMSGYKIATLDRTAFPSMTPTDIYTFPATAAGQANPNLIPRHGYMVLWNFDQDATPQNPPGADVDAAQYLPGNLQKIVPDMGIGRTNVKFVKVLHNIMDKEVVLMRPTLGNDFAPVDSFDCTGLKHQVFIPGTPATATDTKAWHYVRSNDLRQVGAGPNRAWNFVYPGRYDGSFSERRQQGTEMTSWDPATVEEPWVAKPPVTPLIMGRELDPNATTPAPPFHQYNSREKGILSADTSTFPIQIANSDFEGQFKGATQEDGAGKPKKNTPTSLYFPFHGFARAGDVMQAPYIGSYIIVDPNNPTTIVEVNPVTMDSMFAEDTDTDNDMENADAATRGQPEDIGRFSPPLAELTYKHITSTTDTVSVSKIFDSQRKEFSGYWNNCNLIIYNSDQSATTPWRRQFRTVTNYTVSNNGGQFELNKPLNGPLNGQYTYKVQAPRYGNYAWATDLLDYFTTINSPAEDFEPSTDPANPFSPASTKVKNLADTGRLPNRDGLPTEDDVPSEGLININTANWKVLAALPLVMNGTTMNRAASEDLARRIVYFRDVDDGKGVAATSGGKIPTHPHGPFKSLMELCLIPNFFNAEGTIDMTFVPAKNPGLNQGDFSPVKAPVDDINGDYVRLDFEEKYLNLTRISNLLSLRSDCYTVYVQVQGWRDAGSPNATMMVQRRLAFIVDRSHVTPLKPTPTVYNVQVPASGR